MGSTHHCFGTHGRPPTWRQQSDSAGSLGSKTRLAGAPLRPKAACRREQAQRRRLLLQTHAQVGLCPWGSAEPLWAGQVRPWLCSISLHRGRSTLWRYLTDWLSGALAWCKPHTRTCIRMKAPPCSWSTTFFLVSAACCLSGRMSPKGCGARSHKGATEPSRVPGAASLAVAKLHFGACMYELRVNACLLCTQHAMVPLRGRGRCLRSSTCLQHLPLPVGMVTWCMDLHTSAVCWVKWRAMQFLMSDSLPAASLAVHPAWCRDCVRLQPSCLGLQLWPATTIMSSNAC